MENLVENSVENIVEILVENPVGSLWIILWRVVWIKSGECVVNLWRTCGESYGGSCG